MYFLYSRLYRRAIAYSYSSVCGFRKRMMSLSAHATSDPLQPVQKEQYANLAQVLRSQLPGSLKVIGHLNSHLKSDKWFISTYVDSWPEPSVVLVVDYTVEGLSSGDKNVVIHAVDNEKLRNVLQKTQVLNWKKSMTFKGIEGSLLQILEEIKPRDSVLKEEIRADVHMYDNGEALYKGTLNDEYRISKLTGNDIDTVMKIWKFGSDRLRERFLLQTETHFTAGIFSSETGELLSWAIQQHFGAIGAVHTVDSHRRKGFAKIVMSYVAQNVLNSGQIVWAHVEDVKSKHVSENMMRSLGFKPANIQHVWVVYKPTTY